MAKMYRLKESELATFKEELDQEEARARAVIDSLTQDPLGLDDVVNAQSLLVQQEIVARIAALRIKLEENTLLTCDECSGYIEKLRVLLAHALTCKECQKEIDDRTQTASAWMQEDTMEWGEE